MEKKIPFVKDTNQEKVDFALPFLDNVVPFVELFGISQAMLDKIKISAQYSRDIMLFRVNLNAYKKMYTAFNEYVINYVKGIPVEMQAMPTPPIPPAGWLAGWWQKLEEIIRAMKADETHMTPLIRKALGIENIIAIIDNLTLKPTFKVKAGQGGFPLFTIGLQGADGAHIYAESTPGVFTYSGTAASSRYTDNKKPMPAPGLAELRRYKVILVIKDVEIGQLSDIVSFVATGV